MTDSEIAAWLASLGRTPAQQRAALAELLRFAAQDEMSVEDRGICRAALGRLLDKESVQA